MESRSVFLADAAATQALGLQLAQQWLAWARADSGDLATPPILLLQGDLGAGKTCLVQGLAAGLGIDEPITSPTFALAQHYQGCVNQRRTTLVHLDLYRLEQASAADELFAQEEEEAMGLGALMAVEWSERLSIAPDGAWRVRLELVQPDQPEAGRRALLDQVPAG